MKKLLIILACFALIGCATVTTQQDYEEAINNPPEKSNGEIATETIDYAVEAVYWTDFFFDIIHF